MDMPKRALLIVDVQPTFTEGGALGVDGGNAVAERIADFVTANADEYEYIVTTQDWHIEPGGHFSENPDFVDSWPPHGVAGTDEAELHEAIAALPFDDSVKKGEYQAAYSGFEGKNAEGLTLEEMLRQHDIQAVDVVGIAESHCVKETALDSLRAGWPTRVLSDLTVPVSEELGQLARSELDEAGVEQLDSNSAFGFYEENPDELEWNDLYEATDDSEDNFSDEADSDGFNDDDSNAFGAYDDDGEEDTAFGDGFGEDRGTLDLADEDFDLSDFAGAELDGTVATNAQGEDLSEYDLDDFDVDIDEDADFSFDADEEDFDFSDIDDKRI